MHRLRGTLLLAMRDVAAAESNFQQALTVVQHQSAKFWKLRAAISLGRLWRDQGQADRSPRSPRADLRLVHRSFRHAVSRRAFRESPSRIRCIAYEPTSDQPLILTDIRPINN
jgi:hypothetical protein